MRRATFRRLAVTLGVVATTAIVAASAARRTADQAVPLPAGEVKLDLGAWPTIGSATTAAENRRVEDRVSAILAAMTLEEKVGQMLQPEILNITPDEVRQYHVGSVLNGGNGRPNKNLYATASEWLDLADRFYLASVDKTGGRAGVPIIWGLDSVHGNNSVFGGTIFPHNIGLGAANDPALMVEVGRVTAVESAAIGTDWTFAPALSIPRDDRWGRTYEGYAEDPAIAGTLGAAYTTGLQGDPKKQGDFFKAGSIIATAKHFVADGGTRNGRDQGDAEVSEKELRDIHFAPYVATLRAGAQTVMASYSKWNGVRMHGFGPLMTTMLKEHGGFDGFIVGDFNGHAMIPGCTNGNCPQAVNAGLDVFMIPVDWKELRRNLLIQAQDGTIPMARIDDAVRRILRVKMRAGLFDAPKPSSRPFAGERFIGTAAHREVARRAARQSMVLLKDNRALLPIPAKAKVLVTGTAADDVPMLVGGWSMNWQGTGLTNTDFPGSTSVFAGLARTLAENGGSAVLSADGRFTEKPDYAVVVFGETPYAEYQGDRESVLYKPADADRDLTLMKTLQAQGIPVVSIFVSGRPLWINPHLNASDAMIAAFLPGTEGGRAVADLLVAGPNGAPRHEFTGRLSFSWPKLASQTSLNAGMPGYDPLFPLGYGLTLATRTRVAIVPEDPGLSDDLLAAAANSIFFKDGRTLAPWRLYLGDRAEGRLKTEGDRYVTSRTGAIRLESADRHRQEDSKIARWTGKDTARLFVLGYSAVDFAARLGKEEAIVVSMALLEKPSARVEAAFGAVGRNAAVDVTTLLGEAPIGEWGEFSIPLRCFAKGQAQFGKIDMPFMLRTDGTLAIQFSSIAIGSARGRILGCS